jgi:hypothetical protein
LSLIDDSDCLLSTTAIVFDRRQLARVEAGRIPASSRQTVRSFI